MIRFLALRRSAEINAITDLDARAPVIRAYRRPPLAGKLSRIALGYVACGSRTVRIVEAPQERHHVVAIAPRPVSATIAVLNSPEIVFPWLFVTDTLCVRIPGSAGAV